MSYNGWTNHSTWLVNVYYEPQTISDLEFARHDLEEKLEAMDNGILKDMIFLDEIDWHSLKEPVSYTHLTLPTKA